MDHIHTHAWTCGPHTHTHERGGTCFPNNLDNWYVENVFKTYFLAFLTQVQTITPTCVYTWSETSSPNRVQIQNLACLTSSIYASFQAYMPHFKQYASFQAICLISSICVSCQAYVSHVKHMCLMSSICVSCQAYVSLLYPSLFSQHKSWHYGLNHFRRHQLFKECQCGKNTPSTYGR